MFRNYDTNFNTNRNVLSTEMIDPQIGDYVVEALNLRFSRIVNLYENLSLTNVKFFRHREVKVLIEEIDSLISKRYGINFKHINATGFGYAVFPAPPKQYNIINRDIVNNHEETKAYLNAIGKRKSNSYKEVDDFEQHQNEVLYNWVKSVEAIDNQFRKDGITVDLKKAAITNLPKDYIAYIGVDFDILIGKANATGPELTATLMHEIGHAFTHIEYSYRTVNNTAVIVDSLKSVIDETMSYNKALRLSYVKLGGDAKGIDKTNAVTATLMVVNKYMINTRDFDTTNTHSVSDSEQLADQFAGKFGLSSELATMLTKLHKVGEDMNNAAIMEATGIIYLNILLTSLFIAGSISGAIVISAITVGIIFALAIVIESGIDLYTGGGVRGGITYDLDYRRTKRIRNEVVRQLRTTDLPKSVIKEQLSYLKVIDEELLAAKSESKEISNFAKLGRLLFKTNRDASSVKELDELVEDIMENELYIASNKLKTL